MSDQQDFGGILQLFVTAVGNEFAPVLDANGQNVAGIDYEVEFTEGDIIAALRVVSPQRIITDEDSRTLDPDLDLENTEVSRYVRIERIEVSVEDFNPNEEGEGLVLLDQDQLLVDPIVSRSSVILMLNNVSTNRDMLTALDSVRYEIITSEPFPGTRRIRITIFDGFFENSPPAYAFILVRTVSDQVILDLNGRAAGVNAMAVYYEEDPPLSLPPESAIIDEDTPYLLWMTVQLREVLDVGNESLAVINYTIPSSVLCNLADCRGESLNFTGNSSLLNYQEILRNVYYENVRRAEDLPNLSDRFIDVTVFNGEDEVSATLTLDFLPRQERSIIVLDNPNENYTTVFVEHI